MLQEEINSETHIVAFRSLFYFAFKLTTVLKINELSPIFSPLHIQNTVHTHIDTYVQTLLGLF